MDNYATYTYTVNVNVDDDTGEVHAHVYSEAGLVDSVKRGPFDVGMAAHLGAVIALKTYRDHFEPDPAEDDNNETIVALRAITTGELAPGWHRDADGGDVYVFPASFGKEWEPKKPEGDTNAGA